MSIPTPEPGSATTPVYGWHIPTAGDAPNVPFDVTQTALAIEGTVKEHQDEFAATGLAGMAVRWGTILANMTGGAATITYSKPFTATVHPIVCLGATTGPQTVIVFANTATSFTVKMYAEDGTQIISGSHRLNWFVVGPVAAGA